jgi:acyl dehydratase
MKAAIGKSNDPVTYEVTTQGIRLFARAVGYRNPLYFDEEYAKSKGHPTIAAPPGYFGVQVWDPRRTGGGPRRLYESPFTRNLNGGTEVEPIKHIYAGDTLTAVSSLADLQGTVGRLGPMLVQTTETVYTNQKGEVVAKTRGTGLSY